MLQIITDFLNSKEVFFDDYLNSISESKIDSKVLKNKSLNKAKYESNRKI